MRARRRLLISLACALSILLPIGAAGWSAKASVPQRHKHHYQVRWNFLGNAFAAGAASGPNVPPPGANLKCTPSARHPRPVVLVHGLFANQNDNWGAISPYLANHGYCVFALTYGTDPSATGYMDRFGGLGDMTRSAHVLARFVRHVVRVTGAKKVDLVGHSEGGTMPDWYLKFDHGNRHVHRFVDLAGVLHGTTFWGANVLYQLAQAFGYTGGKDVSPSVWCMSCYTEFLPTSPWMKALRAPNPHATAHAAATCATDGVAVAGIKYTSIATRYDELVRPPTSDFIDPSCTNRKTGLSVHNILVQRQCYQDLSDHLSIASDPNVGRDILNALDPKHARPVHCTPVLPAIG